MAKLRAEYTRLLIRYGELWLKGRNRSQFKERACTNLRSALKAEFPEVKVRKDHGRALVILPDAHNSERALEIVAQTPGFSTVAAAQTVERTVEAISEAALKLVAIEWAGATGTFAINSRRADKSFRVPSPTLNRHVGTLVGNATGLKVDLTNPDHTLWIDIDLDDAHIWTHIERGLGGMPVGTAGKAMLLLSGGIDSPVAGYMAQKRGCALSAVYFHSPPFVSEDSRTKVERLAKVLAVRQDGIVLRIVPFTAIQEAIRDHCNPRFAVLLYRRFMYRIAHRLATPARCQALCTGESLSQVASQTLANLCLVEGLGPYITLRPLIT